MGNKRIVFKRNDGTCGILTPALKSNLTLDKIALKDTPEGCSYRIIDVSQIPDSREFRDAWTDNNNTDTVDIDIAKACDIHMERIRYARDIKLKELDIETMKGNDVQVEKQVLRDIPQNTDLSIASTPEELKAIWPPEL